MLTHPGHQRGFTLVELLVALVLSATVSLAALLMFVHSQRSFQAQLATSRVGADTRTAAYVLSGALRGLDAGDSDIVAMSDSDLTVKTTQQIAFVCALPASPYTSLAVSTAESYGVRPFASPDSLIIFADSDSTTSADDVWLHAAATNVATGTCADGSSATVLHPVVTGAGNSRLANVYLGAPVRDLELDRFALFQDADGREYLGISRMVNGTWTALDPVAGPFRQSTGVALTYYDTTGAVTTVPTSVSAVGIVVRGAAATSATLGGGVGAPEQDSVVTRVALRNNRHP